MEKLLEILLMNPETASALIHEYVEKYNRLLRIEEKIGETG